MKKILILSLSVVILSTPVRLFSMQPEEIEYAPGSEPVYEPDLTEDYVRDQGKFITKVKNDSQERVLVVVERSYTPKYATRQTSYSIYGDADDLGTEVPVNYTLDYRKHVPLKPEKTPSGEPIEGIYIPEYQQADKVTVFVGDKKSQLFTLDEFSKRNMLVIDDKGNLKLEHLR